MNFLKYLAESITTEVHPDLGPPGWKIPASNGPIYWGHVNPPHQSQTEPLVSDCWVQKTFFQVTSTGSADRRANRNCDNGEREKTPLRQKWPPRSLSMGA